MAQPSPEALQGFSIEVLPFGRKLAAVPAVDRVKQLALRSMNRAELDAIDLMLRDLNTRHDEIRHRAAFRGCTRELLTLQQELVRYMMVKREGLNGR